MSPAPAGPIVRLWPIDVLFVCTGNICRSPVAEALLLARLAERGVEAHVHSAGLIEGGQPASSVGVEVLQTRGLDLTRHLSRSITRELLVHADLILGLAREHVRSAAVMAPEVWPRTFTLKELVRRGERIGPRRAGEPVDAWLARVHDGRSPSDLTGWSSDDDVADPLGEPRAVYEKMAIELDGLVERVVELVWGAEAPAGQRAAHQVSGTQGSSPG